jgi:hypothetical protein
MCTVRVALGVTEGGRGPGEVPESQVSEPELARDWAGEAGDGLARDNCETLNRGTPMTQSTVTQTVRLAVWHAEPTPHSGWVDVDAEVVGLDGWEAAEWGLVLHRALVNGKVAGLDDDPGWQVSEPNTGLAVAYRDGGWETRELAMDAAKRVLDAAGAEVFVAQVCKGVDMLAKGEWLDYLRVVRTVGSGQQHATRTEIDGGTEDGQQ